MTSDPTGIVNFSVPRFIVHVLNWGSSSKGSVYHESNSVHDGLLVSGKRSALLAVRSLGALLTSVCGDSHSSTLLILQGRRPESPITHPLSHPFPEMESDPSPSTPGGSSGWLLLQKVTHLSLQFRAPTAPSSAPVLWKCCPRT